MADLLTTILPEVRQALTGIPGGTVRKGTDDSRQPVPSWWLTGLGSASLNDIQDLDACELHIWRASRAELDDSLSKVEFLKRYDVGQMTVRRQSVVKAQEEVSVHHATVTLEAKVYPGVSYG